MLLYISKVLNSYVEQKPLPNSGSVICAVIVNNLMMDHYFLKM